MHKGFEDFLKEVYADDFYDSFKNYDFDNWFGNLSMEEIIDYADQWMALFQADLKESAESYEGFISIEKLEKFLTK